MEKIGRGVQVSLLFALVLGSVLPAVLLTGCRRPESSPATSAPAATGKLPQGPPPRPAAAGEEDGQWLMAAKDYANTRYSGLSQITVRNARDLKVAWTFSTGNVRGHEAAPLVVNDTMYIVNPFPNELYALDLTKPGAPTKWVYRPEPAAAAQGVACCDLVNRGAAYADGKIFYNTLDNHTVAVDAVTGQEVWKARLGVQVELRHLRPRSGHRPGPLVLSVEPARRARLRRHQRAGPPRPERRRPPRKVLVRPERNGYVYVLDRATGEVLSADPVFYGTMDGWFKALHAKTGQELWKFKTGSGIIGQPVSYRGPDGRQYVAILSGVGGWAGAIVAGELDPRDATAALGFVNAMKDLPAHTTRGGMLYVFSLP